MLVNATVYPSGATSKESEPPACIHRRLYINAQPEPVTLNKKEVCHGGHDLNPGQRDVYFLGNAFSCKHHLPPTLDILRTQYPDKSVTIVENTTSKNPYF